MGAFIKFGRHLLSRHDWLGSLANTGMNWYESRRGPVYAQQHQRAALASDRSRSAALQQIATRWPDVKSTSTESPVFILSAGWRSGSTMMQRLIMSRESILIWGEPYSHARILHHLGCSVSAITGDWPGDNWFVDRYPLDGLSHRFLANMYPDVQDLLLACLSYTQTLLADPARQRGFDRWGVKDVRLSIDDAAFLQWLYPRARFVFLCRNPYSAYRSYRLDRSWYNEWPDDPVFTVERFGKHWRELTSGFLEGYQQMGAIFIRYEDLCDGTIDAGELEEYLQVKLDTSLLEKRVGTHRHKGDAVPKGELRRLHREVGELARRLGYEA